MAAVGKHCLEDVLKSEIKADTKINSTDSSGEDEVKTGEVLDDNGTEQEPPIEREVDDMGWPEPFDEINIGI